MRIKSLVVGSAIACAALSAHAGTMGVSLNNTAPGFWSADFDSDFLSGALLSPSDTISFGNFLSPLPSGQYDVQLSFHELINTGSTTGSSIKDPIINELITFNGQSILMNTSRTFAYGTTTTSLSGPAAFELIIKGTPTTAYAGYHGTITVTAVPEPESYAMVLAGLGLMAAVSRRRKSRA
jgi:hypothetical protein